MRTIILAIIGLLVLSSTVMALENLDELEARTARKATNTFYSGEDAGNSYIWQPQLVIYTDTTTNHEVQLRTIIPASANNQATEYGWIPWSADGKRIAYTMDTDVGNYTRNASACGGTNRYPWFVSLADGSYLRPFAEGVARTACLQPYFDWNRAVPDQANQLAYNDSGVTGLDQDTVYQVTVTNTGGSYSPLANLGAAGSRPYNMMKGAVSSDGLVQVFSLDAAQAETGPFYFVDLVTGDLLNSWTITSLGLDDTWTGTTPTAEHLHDEYLIGNASTGYWLEFYWTAPNACHWRAAITGSDAGDPTHTPDTSDPYDWWAGTAAQKEVQVLGGYYNVTRPWANSSSGYMSHHSWDVYGINASFNNGDPPSGAVGVGINHFTATPSVTMAATRGNSAYTVWGGFTDWAFGITTDLIAVKTDGTTQTIFSSHTSDTGDFQSPGQSPDGTKAAVFTNWLEGSASQRNLMVPVVMYPYPPEITATEAATGTVTATFEWMLDTTPRGYLTTGWPDPDVDNPPPPRETSKFRLWRSADKTTWTPIGTTDADIFTRYDFTDGTWSGNDYWTITDTPGDGTWYYAVTAIENSGLESKALSNIFVITVSSGSGSGSQDTAYPADPGKLTNPQTSGFYTSYTAGNTALIRYYNIYAADGSPPAISQIARIASVPATADYDADGAFSYVDWLGNTSGNTQYKVTVVDTQGNESTALAGVTATHKQSPATADGQYTLTWDAPTSEADVTAPVITAFVIPATHADLSVPITTFTATDAVGVTGYCVTETNDSATCSWAGTAQTTFVFGSAGSKTLYAFARDAALNISTVASDQVVITLPVANITNVVIGAGVLITNN